MVCIDKQNLRTEHVEHKDVLLTAKVCLIKQLFQSALLPELTGDESCISMKTLVQLHCLLV